MIKLSVKTLYENIFLNFDLGILFSLLSTAFAIFAIICMLMAIYHSSKFFKFIKNK